jgi:hypothetical protein
VIIDVGKTDVGRVAVTEGAGVVRGLGGWVDVAVAVGVRVAVLIGVTIKVGVVGVVTAPVVVGV